jgi:hypothetical protein
MMSSLATRVAYRLCSGPRKLACAPRVHLIHKRFSYSVYGQSSADGMLKTVLPGERYSSRRSSVARAASRSNPEIIVGDILALVVFCLYKQIMAITMASSFAGWHAPLAFNPLRFWELLGFCGTVVGTWVGTSLVFGDYTSGSSGTKPIHPVAGDL